MNEPLVSPLVALTPNDGLTLRDYFAAQAMQSLVNPNCDAGHLVSVAKWSYLMADAMLAERAK